MWLQRQGQKRDPVCRRPGFSKSVFIVVFVVLEEVFLHSSIGQWCMLDELAHFDVPIADLVDAPGSLVHWTKGVRLDGVLGKTQRLGHKECHQ